MLNGTPNILIIDIDLSNKQNIEESLLKKGYKVLFTDNSSNIQNYLNDYDINLLIINFTVPEIKEYFHDVILDEHIKINSFPIIFIIDQYQNDLDAYKDLVLSDFIILPIDEISLTNRVEKLLINRTLQEEQFSINQVLEDMAIEKSEHLTIANKELKKLNNELLRFDIAKSDFFQMISHELRTPLSGIIASLNLLKDSADTFEIKELINSLDFSVVKLEEFSSKTLLLSQLKTKRYKLNVQKTNIHNLLQFTIIDHAEKIKPKSLNINVEKTNHLVHADPNLLRKCFDYIVDNAIKYSNKNGSILIMVNENKNNISIIFKDKGEGFSDNIIKNGIQDLYSAEKIQSLSLNIVEQIMELHQGKLGLSNYKDGALVELVFTKR